MHYIDSGKMQSLSECMATDSSDFCECGEKQTKMSTSVARHSLLHTLNRDNAETLEWMNNIIIKKINESIEESSRDCNK